MDIRDRLNIYRNEKFARELAKKTGGEFIEKVFEDEFGKYWVVIWRYKGEKNDKQAGIKRSNL